MVEKIIRKQGMIKNQEDFSEQKDFSDWEKGWEWHHSTRINPLSVLVGIAMALFGLYWLGKDLGWWTFEVPICPSIMIIVGIVILLAAILKKLQ